MYREEKISSCTARRLGSDILYYNASNETTNMITGGVCFLKSGNLPMFWPYLRTFCLHFTRICLIFALLYACPLTICLSLGYSIDFSIHSYTLCKPHLRLKPLHLAVSASLVLVETLHLLVTLIDFMVTDGSGECLLFPCTGIAE